MAGTKFSGNRTAVYKGPICNGHKKNGDPCGGPAMANGKCHAHGGATPGGIASVHWRTGRHSKYLGPVLGPLVEEAMADPDRHSMESELGLVDARMAQLLGALTGADGPTNWAAMGDAVADLSKATSKAAFAAALERVQSLVAEGLGETQAWGQILELIDKRRVMVESEEKRAITSGRAIPVDQVVNILANLTRAFLDEVPDPDRRRRVSDRIRAIMHGRQLPMTDMPRALMEASRE